MAGAKSFQLKITVMARYHQPQPRDPSHNLEVLLQSALTEILRIGFMG